MAQTAAHLVDHVIPHVPVRQWVLIWVMSLPIPLRLLLAAQPKLVTPGAGVRRSSRANRRSAAGGSARRPEGADGAGRHAKGERLQADAVCRR